MKILDRYIAKNFLIGYGISFSVLIGLRIVVDMFVNLDEFAEHADLGALAVVGNIVSYYGLNATLFFRDFAGTITVVAAAFSLGRMVRNNELTAIMASGVSLKRVVGPILVLAVLMTGLLIADQEWIIPSLGNQLVRDKDTLPGEEWYEAWFLPDDDGSLLCAPKYEVKTTSFYDLTILLREPTDQAGIWRLTGCIQADRAAYNSQTGQWALTGGRRIGRSASEGAVPVATYRGSGLTPKSVPVLARAGDKTLLSWRQLTDLGDLGLRDAGLLYSQKHFRITEPIINLVMLLVSLPVLVCRDPKAMKSAVMISLGLTAGCSLTTFVCKLLSTEPVLWGRLTPEFWAWLPLFIFVPIAFIELDSMKT
jgi:lipopolysaccharide export LptBFGC system permease protein LptF